MKAKVQHEFGTIKDLVDAEPHLKDGLENIGVSSERVKGIAQFVKSNWKTVIPALAALSVGVYVLNNKVLKKSAHENSNEKLS